VAVAPRPVQHLVSEAPPEQKMPHVACLAAALSAHQRDVHVMAIGGVFGTISARGLSPKDSRHPRTETFQ